MANSKHLSDTSAAGLSHYCVPRNTSIVFRESLGFFSTSVVFLLLQSFSISVFFLNFLLLQFVWPWKGTEHCTYKVTHTIWIQMLLWSLSRIPPSMEKADIATDESWTGNEYTTYFSCFIFLIFEVFSVVFLFALNSSVAPLHVSPTFQLISIWHMRTTSASSDVQLWFWSAAQEHVCGGWKPPLRLLPKGKRTQTDTFAGP